MDYTQYYFKVILKDSKGHAVANRNIIIETEIIVSGAPGMTVSHYATTNSKGVAEGYIRPIVNGAVEYDATFKFEGDKSYYSSSAHKYAG